VYGGVFVEHWCKVEILGFAFRVVVAALLQRQPRSPSLPLRLCCMAADDVTIFVARFCWLTRLFVLSRRAVRLVLRGLWHCGVL